MAQAFVLVSVVLVLLSLRVPLPDIKVVHGMHRQLELFSLFPSTLATTCTITYSKEKETYDISHTIGT